MEDYFKIFKFDADDADRVAKEPNDLHVHDYEELLIGLEGQIDHFIDFRSEIIDAPYISCITAGKTHRLKPLKKNDLCNIGVLRFKSDVIAETVSQLYASFQEKSKICSK